MTNITASSACGSKSSIFSNWKRSLSYPSRVQWSDTHAALHHNTRDGTVLAETTAENCSRDYLNPRHRDEDAEELCPRSLPLLSEGGQDLPAEKKLLLPRPIVC